MNIAWILLTTLAALPVDDLPPEARAQNDRGVALFEAKRFREAEEAFREARRAAPEDPTVRENLGHCLLEIGARELHRGEVDEAIRVLDEAVDLMPRSGEAQYRLGVALHRRQSFEAAIRRLEHAVRLSPRHAEAFLWLGRAYYGGGYLRRALAPLERSLEIEPGNEPAETLLERVRREADVEGEFGEVFSQHFRIQASREVSHEVREEVRTALEDAFYKASSLLEYHPDIQFPAILYSEEEFREVTGAHEWVGGLFDGKIRIPVKDFEEHRRAIGRVIDHEVGHAMVRDSCRDAPRWFNEGVAQLIDGTDRKEAAEAAGAAAREGRAPTLEELDGLFQSAEREDVIRAYRLSLAFVHHLILEEGEGRLARVAEACRAGSSFGDAFLRVYRDDPEAMREAWARSAGQRDP